MLLVCYDCATASYDPRWCPIVPPLYLTLITLGLIFASMHVAAGASLIPLLYLSKYVKNGILRYLNSSTLRSFAVSQRPTTCPIHAFHLLLFPSILSSSSKSVRHWPMSTHTCLLLDVLLCVLIEMHSRDIIALSCVAMCTYILRQSNELYNVASG